MEKVVFKLGKFKDFKNEEREVIFCAVSQDLTKDYVYISGAYSDIPKGRLLPSPTARNVNSRCLPISLIIEGISS